MPQTPKKHVANRIEATTDPAVARLVITRRNGDVYHVLIDTTDVDAVSRREWRIVTTDTRGGHLYAGSGNGEGGNHVMLSRYLLAPKPRGVVTFRNGDGLDCRRANLAISTRCEISARTTPTRSNTGERHIYHSRDGHFFVSFSRSSGERTHVGSTATLPGAIELRNSYLAGER